MLIANAILNLPYVLAPGFFKINFSSMFSGLGLKLPILTQTSDWYKRWTATNDGLVQPTDWYKRWSRTNVGPVQTLDGYIYNKKRWTLIEFERKDLCY